MACKFIIFVICYGVLFGLGGGGSTFIPIKVAKTWFPDIQGTFSGILLSGLPLGPILFG